MGAELFVWADCVSDRDANLLFGSVELILNTTNRDYERLKGEKPGDLSVIWSEHTFQIPQTTLLNTQTELCVCVCV